MLEMNRAGNDEFEEEDKPELATAEIFRYSSKRIDRRFLEDHALYHSIWCLLHEMSKKI